MELTDRGGHARIRLGYSVNIVTAFSDFDYNGQANIVNVNGPYIAIKVLLSLKLLAYKRVYRTYF